jgi:hypothetical protein
MNHRGTESQRRGGLNWEENGQRRKRKEDEKVREKEIENITMK